MQDARREIFFPLFALFVIFSDELFCVFFMATGTRLETGMKARLATGIAVVTYILLLVDLVKQRITQRNMMQFTLLGLILVLYFVTGLMYPNGLEKLHHTTYLLVYGALCIPAAYVGMRLARGGHEARTLRILPCFLLPIILFVGYATIFRAVEGGILGGVEGDVTTYQGASYAMSFSCTLCLFLLFFNERKTGVMGMILYGLILVMAFASAIGCLVGGGRGAFLHLVSVSGYIIYRVLGRNDRGKRFRNYFLIALGVVIMAFLAIHFHIFESAGAMRVANNLTVDYNREYLRNVAINSFLKSPFIGHGIGSIWWEVGFYSHNMILDFLVETGSIGTILMVVVMCNMLRKLMRSSRINSFDMFILLLLLYHIVGGTFSGYWLASPRLFMPFGYVYGKQRMVARGRDPYVHGSY